MKILLGLMLSVVLSACGANQISGKAGSASTSGGNSSAGAGNGDSTTSPPSTDGQGQTPGGPVADFKLSCQEARFVYLLNIYRRSQNLSALAVSKNGILSTRWHAQDMINKNYFAHTEPSGRDFSQRASDFGYAAWSENIAAGNTSAEGTFCQWKNSPGHNSNMLGSHHSSIGIGNAIGGGTYGSYWSNNFGPATSDQIAEPLTTESDCVMPTALPDGCS